MSSSPQVITQYRNGVYKEYIVNPVHLINVKNGLLNLANMRLEPHTPDIFSTIQLEVNYEPEAICHVFDRFLDDVCAYTLKGDKAASEEVTNARKQFLLEFMGAVFSNVHADRFNKQVLFLYGPNDTGKTQIKRLVEEMLGYRNFSILNPHISSPTKQRKSIAGTRLTGSGDMSKTEFKCLVNALRNPDSLQKPETVLGSFDGFWWFKAFPYL